MNIEVFKLNIFVYMIHTYHKMCVMCIIPVAIKLKFYNSRCRGYVLSGHGVNPYLLSWNSQFYFIYIHVVCVELPVLFHLHTCGVCGAGGNRKREDTIFFLVKFLRLINFSRCHCFTLMFIQLRHRGETQSIYILKNMKSMTK